QPFLYEKLTGREFLRFIADMYGMDREHGRRRMHEMIDTFGLTSFVDDLTERYSHGMRQRTVFAAALLHEPRVLITDEPTVGLDPQSVRLLKDLLRRHADQGVTVFLSSHSLEIVEKLADRIGVMDRGRLIACGTLDELRRQADYHQGSLEDVFLRMTTEFTASSPAGVAGAPPHGGGPWTTGSRRRRGRAARAPCSSGSGGTCSATRCASWRSIPPSGWSRSCWPASSSGAASSRCRCGASSSWPPSTSRSPAAWSASSSTCCF